MKETLTERMRHAAAHVELYDQEWEAQQLRDGANALELLRQWMRETDWMHFVDDHPEAADWFHNAQVQEPGGALSARSPGTES